MAYRPGRNRGRRGNRGSSGGSPRDLYETYIKKIKDSFFNDVTLTLQSADVMLGSNSFVKNSEQISNTNIQQRTVTTWGIVPTRVSLKGPGEMEGTYTLKELTNTLDSRGGFKAKAGCITTDEFIKKGQRMVGTIASVLGVGFKERIVSMFDFQESLEIFNKKISDNQSKKSEEKVGEMKDQEGVNVLSGDAAGVNEYLLTQRMKAVFGFGDYSGSLFSSQGSRMNTVYGAMHDNMKMEAFDNFSDYLVEDELSVATDVFSALKQLDEDKEALGIE